MRWEDGWLPNAMALAYALGAYALGLWACTAPAWWLNALGVLLTAHALVIAAYLIHECAHNTIFADNRWNAALGEVLLWLTGAGYGRYEDIRHKHFRHIAPTSSRSISGRCSRASRDGLSSSRCSNGPTSRRSI